MDGTTVTMMAPEEAATQVFNTLITQLNFETVLAVIGVGLGAAVGIFLGWWAIRKVSGMTFKAFRKGKVSI